MEDWTNQRIPLEQSIGTIFRKNTLFKMACRPPPPPLTSMCNFSFIYLIAKQLRQQMIEIYIYEQIVYLHLVQINPRRTWPRCQVQTNRLCQMRDNNSASRGNDLVPNKRNSLPCTISTSRHRSCKQRFGCLLFRIARIYESRVGSLDQRKVRGSGPLLWSAINPKYISPTYIHVDCRLTN